MQPFNHCLIEVFTDGGARGNPGPAAFGVVIKKDNKTIYQKGEYLGQKTNNEAEYAGLIHALLWLKNNPLHLNKVEKIVFYLDSQLLASQMKGLYKVKAPNLKPLFNEAKNLEFVLSKTPIIFQHVMREENELADQLVNETLDNNV